MADKFKGKYRIPSHRAYWWDYGDNAAYYVTICTKDKVRFLGDIQNGEMTFSRIGELAQENWKKIPAFAPFSILDEFVIMPNHIHGIIVFEKSEDGFCDRGCPKPE
ncbi:MAG: hypothetical protein AAF206_20990 [Bacteroidota bacterium]